jgi:hypothetical protein
MDPLYAGDLIFSTLLPAPDKGNIRQTRDTLPVEREMALAAQRLYEYVKASVGRKADRTSKGRV